MEIVDKVEKYALEHKPLMPDFPLPDDFIIDEAELRKVFLRRFDGQIGNIEKKLGDADDEKKAAEEAASLDEFAAGNERLKEWLTVSRQYLYLVSLTMQGAHERYGTELDEKTLKRITTENK